MMKKNYFFAMAAVALLAGCSNNEDPEGPDNPTGDDRVEIILGTSSTVETSVTRAPVNSWNNTEVAIFALDKSATADWTDVASGSNDNAGCLLEGIPGTIVSGAANVKVSIDLGSNPYYYPRVSEKEYSFYGVHPYVGEANAADEEGHWLQSRQVIYNYKITGQEDIMWGVAEATGGYNASYFRQPSPPDSPNIDFEHKLTQFNFAIEKGDSYSESECGITELSIKDIPIKGSLIVADETTSNRGTMVWQGTTIGTGGELITSGVADADKATFDIYNNSTPFVLSASETEKEIPNSTVMVPANAQNYKLSVKINGQSSDLTIKLPTDGALFQEGYSYKIKLKINGPEGIVLTASLQEWKDGGTLEFEI